MSCNFAMSALRITAACLMLIFPSHILAKESDPGGKDADTDTEIVFEPTSEGVAAAHSTADAKPIDFDAKRPSILGMTVVEGDDGKPHVVDVGASSPAWDAGIRKDDIILSLHGVEAKSFQEWADGVQKVVADAKAGQTIPVEILRGSSPLDLQVRISDQKGNKPPRPVRKQRPNIAINQAPSIGEQPVQPGGQPYPVGGRGYGGFGVVDGGFDGTASDQAPTRAAAQLMAVNNRAGTAQPPTATGGLPSSRLNDATATPPGSTGVAPGTFPDNRNNPTDASGPPINPGTNAVGSSGQVGTAEFADESGGLLVMVTLGGLPPGNYRVGIGEFSGGVNGVDGAAVSNTQQQIQSNARSRRRAGAVEPSAPRTQLPPEQLQPGLRNRANPNIQPGASGTAPAPAGQPAPIQPGAGAAPSGGAGGAKGGGAAQVARPGYYVLAQATPTAAAQQPAASGGNQKIGAPGTPPTGANPNRQPVNQDQTNQPGFQSGQPIQQNRNGNVAPTNPTGGTTGQFGIDLGVVTVRPNGGGTLQQRLEGIRVKSVVGQSVLVVSADTPIANNGVDAQAQPAHRNTRQAATTHDNGSLGVVATGVIQMSSSRQPTNQQTATQGAATNQNARVPATTQGTTATLPPATGATNPPVPATGATNNSPADRNQR